MAMSFSIQQLAFWLTGWIVPSAYVLHAAGRTFLAGFNTSGTAVIANASIAAALIFLLIFLLTRNAVAVFRRPSDVNVKAALLGCSALAVLFVYSCLIAFGRSVPRGLGYVLGVNVYYAYIAQLAVAVSVALFSLEPHGWHLKSRMAVPEKRKCDKASGVVVTLLILLIAFNAYYSHKLAAAYRFDYSPPRQEFVDRVQYWLAHGGQQQNSYFKVDDSCVGNDPQPLMEAEFSRRNGEWSGSLTTADLLWPEKSWQSNRSTSDAVGAAVATIRCTQITASSTLGESGARRLMSAADPGWRASTPISFPQTLDVDFGYARRLREVRLLSEPGLVVRAPKRLRVEGSTDSHQWEQVYDGESACSRDADDWDALPFTRIVEQRYLRIHILSNCGDPQYLTLRGRGFR
jgi:hypothetical protein